MVSPFNLSLGRQISIAESALQRSTTLRNFFKIQQKSDGSGYEFVFTPTGDVFQTAEQAADHITTLKITDYRTFNASGLGVGERRGAQHIGEEAKALNTRLQRSNMDLETQAIFRKMGLEEYIDQAMTVEYLKFDFGGGKEDLDAFMNSPFGREHGMLNITDDGIMVMRYRNAAGRVIDSAQMKELQYALGLGTLTDKFVDDLMTKDAITVGKKVAKLPKRYKALFSARGFAIAGEDLEESILEFHASRLGITTDAVKAEVKAGRLSTSLKDLAYEYDDIGSFFKGMFSMKDLTKEEKNMLAYGMGIENKDVVKFANMKISGVMDESKAIPQQVKVKLKEMVKAYSGIMSDTDLDDFIQRLGKLFTDRVDLGGAGGDSKKLKNILKNIAEANDPQISGADKEEFAYAKRALAIFDGVERARDGETLTNIQYLESRNRVLEKRLADLKSSIGIPIGLQEQSMIDDIEKEIEANRYKIDHSKSQTLRGGFEGASLKSEDTAIDFKARNMAGELQGKIMVVYKSSLKGEISQGNIESILMDMSMSAPKPVRVDPLMLMYHPDYMNTDELFKGIESTVQRQMQKADKFMKTGVVDKTILDSIRREAEAPLDQFSRFIKSQDDKSKTTSNRNSKGTFSRG